MILLIEHILSFAASVFRDWEIKTNGRPDVNGVMRGPIETMFMNFEQFVDCILFGYIIKHYIELVESGLNNNESFYIFWIICDCMIMFFTLPYNYLTNFLIKTDKVIKNIYSMFYI